MPSSFLVKSLNQRPGSCRFYGFLWLALFSLSFFLPCWSLAQTPITTQRNGNFRSGTYTTETALTPANVNTTSFGKLFSYPVDGRIYAQPLYVPGLTIPGKGTHNVVFVVTEHDSVYAFDADSSGGGDSVPLWEITLFDAAHGAASGAPTVTNGDLSTSDIVPEIGITSTPVIDLSTNTIYVLGKTKEGTAASPTYPQRLHALDITTGAEKFGGPTVISGYVPGNGNGSAAITVSGNGSRNNSWAAKFFGSSGDIQRVKTLRVRWAGGCSFLCFAENINGVCREIDDRCGSYADLWNDVRRTEIAVRYCRGARSRSMSGVQQSNLP